MKVRDLIFKSISMTTDIVTEKGERLATINYSIADDDYETNTYCSRVTIPKEIASRTIVHFIPEDTLKMKIVVK